jgi:hypothetical protein
MPVLPGWFSGSGVFRIYSTVAEVYDLDGYCFKCKIKKEMANPTETRTKNGKIAVTGSCVTCGTKMFKIGIQLESLPEANT